MNLKTNLIKRLATAFALMTVSLAAYAQGSFNVSIKLTDETTGEPVGFATVSVTEKGEEKPAKYVLADEDGAASLTRVKKGTYILKAELMGYKTYEKEITLEKNLDLGTVKLAHDVEALDAAKVTDVGNPIIVKKDTIEYTATSFKTSENDMLEDLLKKLPGVEVSSDGSITANGKTISKIRVDGKEFFMDDPQLASKNLPAKLIEKIKVIDEKSEQAQFTGIDDGQEQTIIDLSVQPGMMNGIFGNIMAGGGHDAPQKGYYNDEHTFMNEGWRYQGNGMIGNFRQGSQLALILNANNTNSMGFGDFAGRMMGGMRGGMGGFGGGGGITSSWMTGLNGAADLFDGDMELSGNYAYNGSDRYSENESSRITYMQDGSQLLNDERSTGRNTTYGHRFGVRMDHEFSKSSSLLFEPQFNFGGGSYVDRSDFITDRSEGGVVTRTNEGFTDGYGDNSNWTASGRLLYRQRLGKVGRTFSANVNYNFSNNQMLGYNQSLTQTDLDNDGNLDNQFVNQRIDQNSQTSSASGRLVYTEPLWNRFFLEASYQYSWNRTMTLKDAYNSSSNDIYTDESGMRHIAYNANGETYDPTYSNSILNRYINQNAGLTLSWQTDRINAQIGARVTPQNTHNETNGETYDNKVVNWSPQARIRYDVTDNANINVSYNGSSSQPSTSQLMPVPDNSNPLRVSLGNPYLEPYFNHNSSVNFRYTNRTTFTSINASVSGGIVQDAITNAQWYDQKGAQYSIPVNGPGTGNANARVMINSPLGKSNFSIMSSSTGRYSESTSYIGTNSLNAEKYYNAQTAEFNYDQFVADFPDLGETDAFTKNKIQTTGFSQSLRLTYRNDFLELIAGGSTNMSKSFYTMNAVNQNATWTNSAQFEANWTLPFGMNLISDLNYRWYNGYTTEQKPEFILNAEITQMLFNRTCTIALRAYDLLNQAKSLSVTDASNYHLESRTNMLGRYVIVSFTWRFGTFGGRRGQGGGPRGGGPGGGGRPAGGLPMGGGFPGGGPGGFRR